MKSNMYKRHRIDEVKQVKKSICVCKKQIKQIGDQVDKEMNKSILKHSKPYATVNIRSIFNHQKNSDPQINRITAEIAKNRNQLNKSKAEIQQIQNKLSNPINTINQERVNATKQRIKEADNEIKQLSSQKQYLEKQIKLLVQDDQKQWDMRDEQLKLNKQKNQQISNLLKEQKSSLYQLEKEDRIITEKIRYMNEMENITAHKQRSKPNVQQTRSKQQIQAQILQLVSQINNMIDKKNRVQIDRKNQLRNLTAQATSIQAKNWEIIGKLREIDAYLIKQYSAKNTKKQKPRQRVSVQEITKQSATMKLKPSVQQINDKNLTFQSQIPPEPVQLVEKKKNYQFGYNLGLQSQGSSILLSDQMLGNKIKMTTLHIVFDDQLIYGTWADYKSNQNNFLLKGYKILPKIKPKQCVTKSLILDEEKSQIINFMHTGNDQNGYIKYLHIITSQGNQFKWGDLSNCLKNDQKNIRKYESICLKGKLIQLIDRQAPNYYCLGGLGFTIIYLGPK